MFHQRCIFKKHKILPNPVTFAWLNRIKPLVIMDYFHLMYSQGLPMNNMFLSLLWYIKYNIMVPHNSEPRICSDSDVESA